MSRTFTHLLSHVVFSTKDRQPLIVPETKSELHAYLGGLTRELKGKAYGINGTSDHVHLLAMRAFSLLPLSVLTRIAAKALFSHELCQKEIS